MALRTHFAFGHLTYCNCKLLLKLSLNMLTTRIKEPLERDHRGSNGQFICPYRSWLWTTSIGLGWRLRWACVAGAAMTASGHCIRPWFEQSRKQDCWIWHLDLAGPATGWRVELGLWAARRHRLTLTARSTRLTHKENTLMMDITTVKVLELMASAHGGDVKKSLLALFNCT